MMGIVQFMRSLLMATLLLTAAATLDLSRSALVLLFELIVQTFVPEARVKRFDVYVLNRFT